MKKGQKKRIWTPEQKLEVVHKHLDDHISVKTLAKEYHADTGMICRWTKEFLEGGEAAFEPKRRPDNRFAALHRSKDLPEIERLRLLVANNYYFECPKCKYRGPSKYHNVCPKCGMAVDD